LQILLLLAGGAGALGLVVILYLVKVNRLKRHGLAARGG